MWTIEAAACGLKWKDQLKRAQREAVLVAESALDTDVAVAAAAVQKQVDDSLAAAASQPTVRQAVTGVWECEHCASRDMFCHRPGPSGKGTLCNGMDGRRRAGWGVEGILWGERLSKGMFGAWRAAERRSVVTVRVLWYLRRQLAVLVLSHCRSGSPAAG